jgi:hypothetical protein
LEVADGGGVDAGVDGGDGGDGDGNTLADAVAAVCVKQADGGDRRRWLLEATDLAVCVSGAGRR